MFIDGGKFLCPESFYAKNVVMDKNSQSLAAEQKNGTLAETASALPEQDWFIIAFVFCSGCTKEERRFMMELNFAKCLDLWDKIKIILCP